MLNQVVLVGRVIEDIELKVNNNDNIYTNLNIAVPRPYINKEGVHETDVISVTIYGEIAKQVSKYSKKGDIVGVKGRLNTSKNDEKKELFIVAEKITFLTSYKN